MNSATPAAATPASPTAETVQPAALDKGFTPLVRQFLDFLKLEKHFSDYTVKSYGADLIQFAQFLAGEIGQAGNNSPAGSMPADQIDQRIVKCEPLT